MSEFRKLLAVISENSCAGAVASVAMPLGSTQKRVKEAEETESVDEEKSKGFENSPKTEAVEAASDYGSPKAPKTEPEATDAAGTPSSPEVIEYGNWENSALVTTGKVKAKRKGSAPEASVYGKKKVSESTSSFAAQGVAEGMMDFMRPQSKPTKDKLTIGAMREIEKANADKNQKSPNFVRASDLPKNQDQVHVRIVKDSKGDYVPPKEADYGDDYQDMVKRVAAHEKRKQQKSQDSGKKAVSEAELSEEQLLAQAKKKREELFKKSRDRDLGDKASDRAVQQKLAEVSDAKQVDMQRWMRDFDRREDKNLHTENMVAIAKLVGSPEEIKMANEIKKEHMKQGYISDELYTLRQVMYKKLWPLVQQKIESSKSVAESWHDTEDDFEQWHAEDPKDEMAGTGDAYNLGRKAYKERKTLKDNPFSHTKEARRADSWEKGFEQGRYDVNENKATLPTEKPRNFVAKNAKMGGAGSHKDKKKAEKQGDFKHKHRDYDLGETVSESGYNHGFASSSAPSLGNRRRDDDESNLMYMYDTNTERLKQGMVAGRNERRAFAEGWRDGQEAALKLHGIIRSKFDPKQWIQKQGTAWVKVYPFGK